MTNQTRGPQQGSGGPGDRGRRGARHLEGSSAGTLTLQETAQALNIHYMTAYRYVRTGTLPAVQQDGRWQVAHRDLIAFRDSRERPHRAGSPRRIRWDGRQRRLLAALLAGDESTAWSQMEAGFAVASPTEVYLRLLAPALREVGEAWARAQVGVADEHRASAVAARLVGRSGPYFRRPGRSRGTVVLGCAPGERHALPVALTADVARAAGWSVVDLGADVPLAALVSAAGAAQRLRAVGISASVTGHATVAAGSVEAVHRAVPGVPVILGGGAVPDQQAAARLGADAWAPDAAALVGVLAGLPRSAPTRGEAP